MAGILCIIFHTPDPAIISLISAPFTFCAIFLNQAGNMDAIYLYSCHPVVHISPSIVISHHLFIPFHNFTCLMLGHHAILWPIHLQT